MFNRKAKTTVQTELSQEGRDWLGFYRVAKRLGQGKLLNPATMSGFIGLCGVPQSDEKRVAEIIQEEERNISDEEKMQQATMGALLNTFAGLNN